jgi:hypothetical protein
LCGSTLRAMTTPDPFAAPDPAAPGGDGTSPYGPPPGYGQPSYEQPPYGPPPQGPPVYGPPPYEARGVPMPYGYLPGYGFAVPASARTNGLAIASLVLGCLWMYWLGSILALVLGYVAKRQIKQTGEQGGGLATAGIVLGWIGIVMLLLFVGLLVPGTSLEGSVDVEQYGEYSSLVQR